MTSSTNSYLDDLRARLSEGNPSANSDRPYRNVVEKATAAWAAAQSELDRLLQVRIDGLTRKLTLSLALTGALTGLSLLIAFMTYRHIAEPLERLENVATKVRETKDYSLRMDYAGKNEIGRLAAAFNDMLAELSSARERERSEQSELMRVARLTTMGAMTASIAHEINQPLAAIAANANASQRWLSKPVPNLDEARLALKKIDADAHRASQVIGSVRAMFRKDDAEKAAVTIDEIIKEVIALVQGELRRHGVTVRIELRDDFPNVIGDRIRLLQMFLNLTRNAIEAMSLVADRQRILAIKSDAHPPEGLLVTVQDTGPGFDSNDSERLFDAFYTTKADGMGMGLSICRRIAESHGGRLWASPVTPHGSAFHVVLPTA
jgi:C4-dicarboxylate-specific signal transduction histidine kinase